MGKPKFAEKLIENFSEKLLLEAYELQKEIDNEFIPKFSEKTIEEKWNLEI